MANTMLLSEKNLRKVRKSITRDRNNSFEVCADHEKRMKADGPADVVASFDPESKAVTLQIVAKLTCGYSKKPCRDTRRMILVDENGFSEKALRAISAEEEEAEEEASAA